MKTWHFIIGSFIVSFIVSLSIIGYVTGYYNKFVDMREGISGAWAQVNNQLKRRNDLIPNLVNTVKGLATHEKDVLDRISAARERLAGARSIPDKIRSAEELDSALSRLLAVIENYPALKTNESFNKLMDELSGTENRIAVERMRYNDVVKMYNIATTRFSGRVFAGVFGFKKGAYYEVPEEKQTPKVQF